MNNRANARFGDAVLAGEGALRNSRRVALAYLVNLRPGQLGPAVFLAGWMPLATLVGHIVHVVGVRPQEQVVDVDAQADIAPMQDAQIARVLLGPQGPSQAVGEHRPAPKRCRSVSARLVAAKSRSGPQKTTTIPGPGFRKEPLACCFESESAAFSPGLLHPAHCAL